MSIFLKLQFLSFFTCCLFVCFSFSQDRGFLYLWSLPVFCFCWFFVGVFKTGFQIVLQLGLDLSLADQVASNSQRSTSLCLPSAGIKGVHHPSLANKALVGFSREGFSVYVRLCWDSNYTAGCSQTHRDLPVSSAQVQEFKACTTTSWPNMHFFISFFVCENMVIFIVWFHTIETIFTLA